MEKTRLAIVTPYGKIYDGDVVSVTLPGSDGEFGVLPHHVGLVTTLQAGIIDFETPSGYKESVVIQWGGVKIDEGSIDVLVDEAVAIRGNNESEVAKAIEDAKKLLSDVQNAHNLIASVESKIELAAKNYI